MRVPRVSVVVPCYNGGAFLDELMASLAAQTFRDFEIIVVDDGSNDLGTLAKLASLKDEVRLIRQGNRGLPTARNTGFRVAQGDLLLPLDCDDTLEPDFLSATVSTLDAAPDAAFVFTHMRLVGALQGVLPRRFEPLRQLFLNGLPYCLLMRRSAWKKVGGYDETMRDGYEDWEFNIRLQSAGCRGIELPRPLFVYRVSAQGMLMSKSARLHGALWRAIRNRHPELYRQRNLRALYATSTVRTRVTTLAALWAGRLLPEAVTGYAFHTLLQASHRHAVRQGKLSRGEDGLPATTRASDVNVLKSFQEDRHV